MIRTKAPEIDNRFYLTAGGGGFNKCIPGNERNRRNARPSHFSVLPNCVGYCYGRYLEFRGIKSAPLPTCNAGDWLAQGERAGFSVDRYPSVGSVAVFRGTDLGHVVFVERIEENGDILVSESNWNGSLFELVTLKRSKGFRRTAKLKCVGFLSDPPEKKTPLFAPGSYVVTAGALNVREGAGTKFRAKRFSELTGSAQRQILSLCGKKKNAYVKGVVFTVSEVRSAGGYSWGKTPSGWVALEFCERRSV